ncbi:MAG: hypothetical protein KF797_14840, partial [Flavobacteriales bacterium]|nr:hypothetical protein [Flavobacteriales bacterium]
KEAPFDRILITCGAPAIPEGLPSQLKPATADRPGGLMVVPVGAGDEQRMLRVELLPDGSLAHRDLGGFRFVPMLEKKA